MSTSVSLVIPAFNEGLRLGSGLQRLMEGISPDDTEIIVVDDGSVDDTADVARSLLASWPQGSVVSLDRNRGKGAAVRTGVMQARGKVIAYLDADMATDPQDLASLLRAVEANHVAVGSRGLNESVVERSGQREMMNRTFGMLVASLTHLPYMDTQCGFKAFQGPIAKLLFHGSRVDRFAFDVEVLDLAARSGLQIEQIPVHWTDVEGSHVRPMHDSVQMLGDVMRNRLMRRTRPPIQGVFMPEVPIQDASALIQPAIRKVDLLMRWNKGTAVLLPSLSRPMANRVSTRLLSDFEDYDPREMSVEFRSLTGPVMARNILDGALVA